MCSGQYILRIHVKIHTHMKQIISIHEELKICNVEKNSKSPIKIALFKLQFFEHIL